MKKLFPIASGLVATVGVGLMVQGTIQKRPVDVPAAVVAGQLDQAALPAGVDLATPIAGRAHGFRDVVFSRTKSMLKVEVLGAFNFHKHKPTTYRVSLTRLYYENFYVGGQKGVTSGRQVNQLLGETEIPADKLKDVAFIKAKIASEAADQVPVAEEVSE